jgi:hypothetical protein
VLDRYLQRREILAIIFGGGADSGRVRGGREILRAILGAGAGGICDENAVVSVTPDFDDSDGQEQEQRSDQRYFQQGLA